jgi:ABC-type branched-subunit amino acid transport system ATPase component
MTDPLLHAEQVEKRFGGLRALKGVSVSVQRGSITGLIGPNGSGKTTLFNAITGFVRADAGSVRFDGREIARTAPHRIVGLGLARTFQNPADFPEMTVIENLLASQRHHAGDSLLRTAFTPWQVHRAERETIRQAWSIMRDLEIEDLANTPAGELSVGANRLLQIGRHLMMRPSMLLLDEPTSGLNPELQGRLAEQIAQLRSTSGVTFLIIEHNLGFIRTLCEQLYVMHLGEVIASGHPEDVSNDPRVIDTYLGTGGERQLA